MLLPQFLIAFALLGRAIDATEISRSYRVPRGFVHAVGQKFYLDGKTFYFAGANAYWISFTAELADVEKTMDEAKAAGLRVIRTDGFNDKNVTYVPDGMPKYGGDTYPGEIVYQWWANGTATINTDANTGLGRLDKVVKLAEQKGLKLIMTLVNNWADYGGMDVYTVNLGGKYHDDFYKNPKIIAAYKKFVKAVVSRYKTSPAIFAWELANEPRCGANDARNLLRSPSGCTTKTITAWIENVSKYIKSIDPHHMVTIGDEGAFNVPSIADNFYNGTDGIDFNKNLQIPTIDFGTFHLYPDFWSETVQWGTQYVRDHAASQKKYNKPVILEEYGWLHEADREAWLGKKSNITRVQAMVAWQQASIEERLGGDLYWQFGTRDLSTDNSTNDGFTIYIQDAEADIPVRQHAANVNRLNH